MAFLWCPSGLDRLTSSLDTVAGLWLLFFLQVRQRTAVRWEGTVADTPGPAASWILAAWEGWRSPPVQSEFRTIHHKTVLLRMVLLSQPVLFPSFF